MRTWDEAIEDPLYAVWVQGECKAFCEGFRNGWLDRSNGFRSIVADTAGGNYSHGYLMGQRAHEVESK